MSDELVMTVAEPAINFFITANVNNVKWIAFTNGGYKTQDGGAGAVTDNSWIGDYWTAVLEKALDYYSKCEVL